MVRQVENSRSGLSVEEPATQPPADEEIFILNGNFYDWKQSKTDALMKKSEET